MTITISCHTTGLKCSTWYHLLCTPLHFPGDTTESLHQLIYITRNYNKKFFILWISCAHILHTTYICSGNYCQLWFFSTAIQPVKLSLAPGSILIDKDRWRNCKQSSWFIWRHWVNKEDFVQVVSVAKLKFVGGTERQKKPLIWSEK